jgi:uncharacterized protein YgbK (DUF1537 family)
MTTLGRTTSRLVIVADDLTSATDCGVQMMTGGFPAFIPLCATCRIPHSAAVVALDTDSREASKKVAYDLTRKAVAPFLEDSQVVFYKSVDSTLRGNLGAELDAVMDAVSFDAAIIAPAFPTYGRTTVGGRQLFEGRPIDETEFGSDPTSPIGSASVAERFAEQSRRAAVVVSLETQTGGAAAVREVIARNRKAGKELFVFDACEEDHLKRLAELVGALPGRYLWVGSTGLSRYVPSAVRLVPHAPLQRAPVSRGCVLVVAGSASATTRAQLNACAETVGMVEIRVNSMEVAEGGDCERRERERVRRQLRDAVCQPDAVALTLASSRQEIDRTKARARARVPPVVDIEAYLARMLGCLTAEALNGGARVKGLVLTGGTTAKMVALALSAESIEILEEIDPGIPLGHLSGPRELLVVTKAGGFGGPEAILGAVQGIANYGRT